MVARPTAGEAALVVAVRWGEASRRAATAKMATLPVKAPRASANWESRLPGGVLTQPRIYIPNRAQNFFAKIVDYDLQNRDDVV